MKKTIFTLLFLIFSFPVSAADKESTYDRVMRTGTPRCGFVPWPPGFEIDPNTNEVKGPGKTLFESIIQLAGWKTEFVQATLGNVPLDMQNGKFDAMCGDGPWTIANIKFIDYTVPVAYTPVFVYVRADETRFKSYEDFNKESVSFAGIDGDVSVDLAALRFPQAKMHTLINLTDPATMLLEVADDKADAVILDPVTADSFIKNDPGRIKEFLPERGRKSLAIYPIGMSVAWGDHQLKEVLNRASEMAINTGLVNEKLDLYDPTRRTLYEPAPFYQDPR